jgi:phasin family protein
MNEFNIPGVEFETVVAAQRRNIEAFTQVNRLAMENFQTIAKRQAEIMQSAMSESAEAAKDIFSSKNPQDAASLQAELTGRAVEQGFAHMRELTELTAKSNAKVFDLINQRFAESLDEFKGNSKASKASK